MRRRVPLVLLVLTSLTLITLDVGTHLVGPYARAARNATAAVAIPLQQHLATLTENGNAGAELDRLRAANARLTAENGLLRTSITTETDGRVGQALSGEELIPARVVAPVTGVTGNVADTGFGGTVQLDVGTADGVRRGAGVIAPDGVVGRVLRAGRTVSTVLLLTDPRSTIGVRHVDSGRLGLADGNGGAGATLRMVRADTPMRTGDALVTWGSSENRPYPPGVPVGQLGTIDRSPGARTVGQLTPAADPARLDRVVVTR